MENYQDFQLIKEKIIKTDHVLDILRKLKKENALLKKSLQENCKKQKQLIDNIAVLNLENDRKLHQSEEQVKELEKLKIDFEDVRCRYHSMKQDYLEQSAQMQMMQIKYQSTCKELENFETTFKQHLEQSLKDEKPKRRTRKHKVTEDSDSTSSNEDDESKEEAKMIEIKLNELSENDSEQAEISRLENVIKSNKNNIDISRLEIEKLTTLNNVLREELKQTHEEKANLNVFWQEKTKGMENTWARTETLLKSEIVELQMRLKMFTEKKESDLTENALDLSIDKKNISEIELKEQSDSESFENIDDIFEEMRLRHLISPMPLFDEDQIYINNCSTDQIPPSLSLTEIVPDINERNLSLLESPSKSKYTDRYEAIRKRKIQRWLKKRMKQRSKHSKVMNKIPKYIDEKEEFKNEVFAFVNQLINQKLKNPRFRRKTLPDGPKNVLEVNKMLLEKARQLNATSFSPTGDVEEINKSNEIEKDSDNGIPVDSVSANASASESISELSFSIFDSCYETLESNPPSIEMASINVVAVEKQFSSEQKLIRSNESDQVEEAKNIPNEDILESSHSRMSSATGIKTDYYYNLDNNIETESVFHSENKTSSSINGDSSLQNIENEMQLFDDDLRASLIDFCVFPLQESHESDFKPINSTQEMYLKLQKDEIGIGENKIETDITSHIKEQEHTNNLLHNDLENEKTAKIEIGLTNSPNLTNSNSSEMDFEDFTSMNDGDDRRQINQSKSCSLDDFLDIRLSKSYVECEDNFSRTESELERKKIKVEINNSLKTFDESLKVSSVEDTKEDTLNVCNQAQNDTESPEKPTNKTEIKQIPPKTHFEEFEKEQANTNQSLVCKSHLKNFKTVKLMKHRVLSSGNDSEEIETVKKVLRNGKLVQTKIKKYSLKSSKNYRRTCITRDNTLRKNKTRAYKRKNISIVVKNPSTLDKIEEKTEGVHNVKDENTIISKIVEESSKKENFPENLKSSANLSPQKQENALPCFADAFDENVKIASDDEMNFSIELEEIKKNYIRTQELISSFSESSDREFADHIFRNSSTPTPWKHNQLEEEVKDVSSNKINTLIKKGNENLSEIDSESEEIQKNDELSWKNTKISVETTPRQDSTSSAETEAVPPKIVPKEIEKSENCSDKKDLELNLNYVQEQVPEEAEMGENLDIRTCQNIKQINDKEKRDICSSQMQCPGDNEDRVQIQTEQKEENKPEKKVLRKRRIRTYKEENVRKKRIKSTDKTNPESINEETQFKQETITQVSTDSNEICNKESKKERKFNYANFEIPVTEKVRKKSVFEKAISRVKDSKEEEKKINIIQDVLLRPCPLTTTTQKVVIKAAPELKTSNFKRPNNTKIIPACPLSPTPSEEDTTLCSEPVIIPLEKPPSMESSAAEAFFRKLITYSEEEKTVEEVARQFTSQDVDHISNLILAHLIHNAGIVDSKYPAAPLMTDTQRIMFGFMLKLENMRVENLIETYLETSEMHLLHANSLHMVDSITRLYVAICKSRGLIGRVRRMCFDAFYFMGDLAIPFFFIVLTSWIEVLPLEINSTDFPMVKVLIQLVNIKTCNLPGYNLLLLRELLSKYYRYPNEPWNSDQFFKELFTDYLKNPARPGDFGLLVFCKNNTCKWVCDKIEKLVKPTLASIVNENFKATVIILICNIVSQFKQKTDTEHINSMRSWLKSIIEDEGVAEVVKKSVILGLKKIPTCKKIASKQTNELNC